MPSVIVQVSAFESSDFMALWF